MNEDLFHHAQPLSHPSSYLPPLSPAHSLGGGVGSPGMSPLMQRRHEAAASPAHHRPMYRGAGVFLGSTGRSNTFWGRQMQHKQQPWDGQMEMQSHSCTSSPVRTRRNVYPKNMNNMNNGNVMNNGPPPLQAGNNSLEMSPASSPKRHLHSQSSGNLYWTAKVEITDI